MQMMGWQGSYIRLLLVFVMHVKAVQRIHLSNGESRHASR